MAGSPSRAKQDMPAKAVDRLSASLRLEDEISKVKLVSPSRAKALGSLGVSCVRDMLCHFPRRYLDLSATQTISGASIGQSYTIYGLVHEIKVKKPNPRMVLTEITLVDGTGTLIVTAFRQPWLADQIQKGDHVAVAGKLEFDYGFKRMTNPFIEKVDGDGASFGGKVIPIHPACEKISAAWMRRIVSNTLDYCTGLQDPLPLDIRIRHDLMSRQSAFRSIHFPASMQEVHQARKRLAYEELLLLQLRLLSEDRKRWENLSPIEHVVDGPKMRALEHEVPFTLTEDQAKAKREVLTSLHAPCCSSHLVLGDVGTGKTMVAAFAFAAAADTQGQALFMAPTEVLAKQHFKTLSILFDRAGITCDLLTGSTEASQRELILSRAKSGVTDVLIGTHALLEDDVILNNCTLVVIDEQQRFGVNQRERLLQKGSAPDALFLTATPIPRTLALALYGNLTLSYLSQKPHIGAKRDTFLIRKDQQGIAYDAAKEALSRGQQVYVVCPLIGLSSKDRDQKARRGEDDDEYLSISIESEEDYLSDNLVEATKEAEYLQSSIFVDYRVELLHGAMDAESKAQAMARFASNESQVLVSTTVIEVGVDVPNATVMIIQDADRFGLSQLHQLRGRVGRGALDSKVYLVSASKQKQALDRLGMLERTDDGFKLASFDLGLRREGDILGNRQHGASSLKLVNVVRDGALIELAHRDALEIIEQDPTLSTSRFAALAREMRLTLPLDAVSQGG